MKNLLVDSFAYLFTLFLLISIGSCATSNSTPPSATETGPRTIILNDDLKISEDLTGGFKSWYCKDFIYEDKVVLEAGFFNKSDWDLFGFILYDGGFTGKTAIYGRNGLERRWDWGDEYGKYAFIIKPDGTGLYYDFSSVASGESTKASDVYKCYQR